VSSCRPKRSIRFSVRQGALRFEADRRKPRERGGQKNPFQMEPGSTHCTGWLIGCALDGEAQEVFALAAGLPVEREQYQGGGGVGFHLDNGNTRDPFPPRHIG